MISAKEAKELYDASGAEADAVLQKIEPVVVKAATAGKRQVFYYLGSNETRNALAATPVESQVVDKLRSIGYTVTLTEDDDGPFTPKGLATGDGDRPMYYGYGLQIKW